MASLHHTLAEYQPNLLICHHGSHARNWNWLSLEQQRRKLLLSQPSKCMHPSLIPTSSTDDIPQSVILVVYLQWVNPPVYEVPLSYIAPMSLAVTTLGVLYQVVLTLDAYRIKNNIQLFTQCICNICLSISTVMQYSQIKDANDRILVGYNMYNLPFAKNDRHFWKHISPGLIVCIVLSCVCSVAMSILAFGLHREFAWAIYQHISPDKKTRNRYFGYQVSSSVFHFPCVCLLYSRSILSS